MKNQLSSINARVYREHEKPTAPACPAGEHTPGPWTVGLDYDGAPLIVEYQCRDICRVDSRDGVSNARLIARAPALLVEIARLRAALAGCVSEPGCCALIHPKQYAVRRLQAITDIARAALAGEVGK